MKALILLAWIGADILLYMLGHLILISNKNIEDIKEPKKLPKFKYYLYGICLYIFPVLGCICLLFSYPFCILFHFYDRIMEKQ